MSGGSDARSDLDLYVYLNAELPVTTRACLAAAMGPAGQVELDNRFWETGDKWAEAATGFGVDVMYRDPRWIEGELARVLDRCEASLGYTTCLWFNVLTSEVLFDRTSWLGGLKHSADRPYPEALRWAVIGKNQSVLRDNCSSYPRQIELAVTRGDAVTVNHRVTGLLASCFDILFAVNRRPHPGEKRLIEHAPALGMIGPERFAGHVGALLAGIGTLC
jgi:hypothetical protein